MTTPAGWYPDPHDPSKQRFWDGAAWTENVAPTVAPEPTLQFSTMPPPPPPSPFGAAAPRSEPWYKRGWVIGVGATLGVLFLIGLIGSIGAEEDPEPSAAEPRAVETVTETAEPSPAVTETVTATPTPEPEPVVEASEPARVGENEPASGGTFRMPDEVGKVLQVAQDDLQAITGNSFFYTGSEDALGQNRFQVLDSNWKVCSQKPKAGKKLSVDYQDIVFYVVKLTEDCP